MNEKTTTARATVTEKAENSTGEIVFRALTKEEIQCKAEQNYEGNVSVALYKDARCDMNVLDETIGFGNYSRIHRSELLMKADGRWVVPCTILIKGAEVEYTDIGEGDTPKAAYSDSLKRACFALGIGRELYTAPTIEIPHDFFVDRTPKVTNTNLSLPTPVPYDTIFVSDIKTKGGIAKVIEEIELSMTYNGKTTVIAKWSKGDSEPTYIMPEWAKPVTRISDMEEPPVVNDSANTYNPDAPFDVTVQNINNANPNGNQQNFDPANNGNFSGQNNGVYNNNQQAPNNVGFNQPNPNNGGNFNGNQQTPNNGNFNNQPNPTNNGYNNGGYNGNNGNFNNQPNYNGYNNGYGYSQNTPNQPPINDGRAWGGYNGNNGY